MDVREKLVGLANDVLRYLPWGEIQKDTAERIADRMMDYGVTVKDGTSNLENAMGRLGRFGRLFVEYQGCPRGPIGRAGCIGNDSSLKRLQALINEAQTMEPIQDIDNNRWVPVLEYVLNDLIHAAKEATVQEWISVDDRLPEIVSTHKRYRSTIKKSIRVLCVCVQKSGKTMVKEGYCEWYNDYPEPRWQIPGTIDEVTHWQYLPKPPKGE